MKPDDAEMEETGRVVLETIAQVAEPILERKLTERGVSSPDALPPSVRKELFFEAFREAAPLAVPGVDVEKLLMGFENFTDESFLESHRNVRSQDETTDAFEPATGLAQALVMAGIGLPVAPFDPIGASLVAPYSNKLDDVKLAFGDTDEFLVCYNSAEASFYSLQTDCMNTLSSSLKYKKAARPVRTLVKRAKFTIPRQKDRFVHFAMLFARHPGDQIPSVMMLDDDPKRGSILLNAGWRDSSGNVVGAPADGRASVPAGLARRVTVEPKLAFWLTEPHDKPPITLH